MTRCHAPPSGVLLQRCSRLTKLLLLSFLGKADLFGSIISPHGSTEDCKTPLPRVRIVTHADYEDDFWGVWSDGARHAARDRAELTFAHVGYNATAAEWHIAMSCSDGGEDALVVTVPYHIDTYEYHFLDAAITKCTEKIPVFTANTDTYHNPKVYAYIGSHNYQLGVQCALTYLFGHECQNDRFEIISGRVSPPDAVEYFFFLAGNEGHYVLEGHEFDGNWGMLRRLQGVNETFNRYGVPLVFNKRHEYQPEPYNGKRAMVSSINIAKDYGYKSKIICGDEAVDLPNTAQVGQSPFVQGATAVSLAVVAAGNDTDWNAMKGNNGMNTESKSIAGISAKITHLVNQWLVNVTYDYEHNEEYLKNTTEKFIEYLTEQGRICNANLSIAFANFYESYQDFKKHASDNNDANWKPGPCMELGNGSACDPMEYMQEGMSYYMQIADGDDEDEERRRLETELENHDPEDEERSKLSPGAEQLLKELEPHHEMHHNETLRLQREFHEELAEAGLDHMIEDEEGDDEAGNQSGRAHGWRRRLKTAWKIDWEPVFGDTQPAQTCYECGSRKGDGCKQGCWAFAATANVQARLTIWYLMTVLGKKPWKIMYDLNSCYNEPGGPYDWKCVEERGGIPTRLRENYLSARQLIDCNLGHCAQKASWTYEAKDCKGSFLYDCNTRGGTYHGGLNEIALRGVASVRRYPNKYHGLPDPDAHCTGRLKDRCGMKTNLWGGHPVGGSRERCRLWDWPAMPMMAKIGGDDCLDPKLPKGKWIEALKSRLLTGPVLVSVNIAIYSSFAVTYKNGPIVYNPINQRYSRKNTDGSRTINHAVNLVGYGRTKVEGRMMQYWKVLNSLSTKWGEGGFFRMELNAFMGGIKQIDPCWAKDVEPGKDFVCLGLPGYNYWQHGGYTTREKPDCTVYTKPPKCQDQDPNYKNNPRFAKAYKDYQNGGCSSAAY